MIQDLARPQGGARRADSWLYIAEIEHRMANAYALAVASLSLVASRCSDADVKAALGAAAQRLRDHANVHRALQAPMTSGPADLSLYLRALSNAIVKATLAERRVSLTLIEQSIELDVERCWRVGLIVSELITNAVRHGFGGGPGAITIDMVRSRGFVQCRISDDGRPSMGSPPGNGTRLVDSLAEELGGRIYRSFSEAGTIVLLSFPEQGELGLHDVASCNG